ncbi:MAG: hypothetical protein AB1710_09350 [Pseudomonadota bacterium]
MPKHPPLPEYEVEFIPLERRLGERRKADSAAYTGPERRKKDSRRRVEQNVPSGDKSEKP